MCIPQGDCNGGTTPVENGRRFLTLLVCAGCLLTGRKVAFARAERSRTPPDLPEQAAFILEVGNPNKQVASENVSRSPCV